MSLTSTNEFRIERDTLGDLQVPAEHLWGAQTERFHMNFPIAGEFFRWGRPVIRALGILKKCAALANGELGQLPREKVNLIVRAAQEVIDGRWDDDFRLLVFQAGSGTQTNMNANEVIANRAIQLAGGIVGSKKPIHPNDDVNHNQSSNDTFPAAMHIATVEAIEGKLFPALRGLRDVLEGKSQQYRDVVMVGRADLERAAPLTLGQLISGWVAQIDHALDGIRRTLPGIYALAIGGPAVGTGLNAHPRFGEVTARRIAEETSQPFVADANKFPALSAHDGMVSVSGALRTLAGALMKIGNDVRWHTRGPSAGIGDLRIPEPEAGSSIMPGKINPNQCEALTMVAVQVFGNDHTVAFAGSQENFQLNVCGPVILHNVLMSIELLADASRSFCECSAIRIVPNEQRIEEYPDNSLMLVTALNPHRGYERAANIRDLQNLIVRAVILSGDGELPNPFLTAGGSAATTAPAATTLKDSERILILRTLESVGWVIGGAKGAAAKLGLKRTTLIHRMQKLGISRSSQLRSPGKMRPSTQEPSPPLQLPPKRRTV